MGGTPIHWCVQVCLGLPACRGGRGDSMVHVVGRFEHGDNMATNVDME